ncbi:double-strand break repair protein AddB [Paramagnetospirillum kuznetsovii]|uniref:Double-strand break repair protein AddB n=1 Tax=Paramagnetospirillum kuznetsovii TaxID=2053833 RepID=A0A364P1F4_9PROT|nr:double-strand break repair protein AddB [Paramagnetospirillum kuznetsovii]RAU23143.1 double-strand break repair protein AddB [Paramagnetospirillum kuznetsovii]
MTVFTIPPGLPFVDTLAAWLLAEAKDDPLALAEMEVLLPTRRACRALSDAFLRLSGGRPLLLPRLKPLGDMDEEELELSGADPLDISPAMAPLERRLILARLITAMAKALGGHVPSPDQAARLAGELGKLLDAVQSERLDFARLEHLVPADYAEHWQVTLDFLKILTQSWPAILAEGGALDSEDRLNRVMAAQINAWTAKPPAHPIIAAGSTGSRPATADLLACVAGLPLGRVVLPGLDRHMDATAWRVLEPSHPQFGLKALLARLGIEREAVPPLVADADPRAARTRLLAEALRPAGACEAWRDLTPLPPDTLDGVTRLDAPGPREEAGAIALMLRHALDSPGRTAALVTPDRALARRVAGELERWGIRIDDSAGRPLGLTEPGAFLRLTAEMTAEHFAPHPLLACLKHPLAAGGMDEGAFRALTRRLEVTTLRGPRPGPGIGGLLVMVKDRRLAALLADLEAVAAPFAALLAKDSVPLADLLRAHMEFAEKLAADDRLPGPARLWKGEAGEACARFAADLARAAPALGEIPGACYPALLDELMAGVAARSAWDHHPRLQIWGPLEARLQHADLLILGGLNEGTWPSPPEADPWMSRPMQAAFGLAPPERRIGLAAHDFAQGFAAPQVVLTRSVRAEGTPTVPSRWLMRLEAVMHACGLTFEEDATQWLDWHAMLDRPERWTRAEPPAPRPPLDARPRRLSVTEIETWMRDPYGIYAKHVLGLKALDPIDADPGAADYGSMVHLALERFAKAYPAALPHDAEAKLLEIGAEVFAEAVASPAVWAFWWPRFQSIARWVAVKERERRPDIAAIHAEVKGALEIDAPYAPFTLIAKADRVDVLKDGSLALIDYKTGQPPSAKEVAAGYAPQLPLEGAMARYGGFGGVKAAEPSRLLYWRLKGGEAGGEEKSAGDDAYTLATEALDGLRALITAFDDPETPYAARPHPEHAPKYSDYLHLARVREWASGGEDGEE